MNGGAGVRAAAPFSGTGQGRTGTVLKRTGVDVDRRGVDSDCASAESARCGETSAHGFPFCQYAGMDAIGLRDDGSGSDRSELSMPGVSRPHGSEVSPRSSLRARPGRCERVREQLAIDEVRQSSAVLVHAEPNALQAWVRTAATSSRRHRTPNLSNTALRCSCTVFAEMCSVSTISRVLRP